MIACDRPPLSPEDQRIQMTLTQQIRRMRMNGVCETYTDGLRLIYDRLKEQRFPVGAIEEWLEKWGGIA